jgi:hypothetical protein
MDKSKTIPGVNVLSSWQLLKALMRNTAKAGLWKRLQNSKCSYIWVL